VALAKPESANPGRAKVISGRPKPTDIGRVSQSVRALPARFDKADIMRKTALLTGVAGLFLMTAPAFAQDSTAPQTPPAPAEQAAAPAPTQSLTLQPGSDVKGSDGAVLGKLEGARNTEAGQELTVRGADGALRGIPVSGGVRQDGAGVAVGWTSAQFSAAAAIEGDASPASDDAAPTEPATTPDGRMPSGPGQTGARAGDWIGVTRWMAIGAAQAGVWGAAAVALTLANRPSRTVLMDRAARGLGKVFWMKGLEPRFYGARELARLEKLSRSGDAGSPAATSAGG